MKTGNPLIDDSTAEFVIGSDEVGYGALAGPLLVCGTLLPRGWRERDVTDSKAIKNEKKRRRIFERWTQETPIPYALAWVEAPAIDRDGVWEALTGAHRQVLRELVGRATGSHLIVVDGFKHGTQKIGVPDAIGLPKGDLLVPAVSLASIIAKVTRDELMDRLAIHHPGYGFARHKGYGTPEHMEALVRLGPCPIHRRSYLPKDKDLKAYDFGTEDEVFLE